MEPERGAAAGEPVPIRLLVHVAAGALLGGACGFGVGEVVPAVAIDAAHAGFHAGWLAGLLSWFAATRRAAAARGRTRAESVVAGALLLGGGGFVIGFYGPMVLRPGANQGPMLGILFTGPLGFTLGALLGHLHHRRRGGAGA